MAESRPAFWAETERLVLRSEMDGDRAVWLSHMNTEAVMACLGGPAPPEKVAASFDAMAGALASGAPPFLLIALKSEGTLIGKCGLAPIETAEAPPELRAALQIGWTLRADHWGQGYAQEAARATFALGFEKHRLAIIYGQTSQSNAGSWRLMERLGMTRRTDLDYADPAYPARDNPTIVYALARDQWRAGQQEPRP